MVEKTEFKIKGPLGYKGEPPISIVCQTDDDYALECTIEDDVKIRMTPIRAIISRKPPITKDRMFEVDADEHSISRVQRVYVDWFRGGV
jgi:hypothetical protein